MMFFKLVGLKSRRQGGKAEAGTISGNKAKDERLTFFIPVK